jgi:hypothetical protein
MIRGNLSIENARIGFRNFEGAEGKFNAKGKRNFCIFLDYDQAKELEVDGWNIKWLHPREEGDTEQGYMQVAVAFDNMPPTIWIVTKKNKRKIDQDSIILLDWAEIANVDLTIKPYNWEVSGKTGVKAYLKSMFVTIVEDEFEDKYSNVPDSAMNTMGVNVG